MPAPLSGSLAWTTPNLATTGGTALSPDYNAILQDLGLLYAAPHITVVQTAGTLVPVVSTDPANNTCGLFGSAPSGGTATGVAASTHQNSPASGAGSFGFITTSGRITPPSTAPGNYDIYAQAVLTTSANAAYARLSVIVVNAGGTVIASYPGRWSTGMTTGAGFHEIINVRADNIPFNVSSWYGDTGVWFFIIAESNSGTGTPTLGYNDNSLGPNSVPPRLYTFCTAKWTGSYGNI